MSDPATAPPRAAGDRPAASPRLDGGLHPGGTIAFLLVRVAGLVYSAVSLIADMNAIGEAPP